MKKLFFVFLFLLFAVIALTINLKNPQTVQLDYYFNLQWESSLGLLLMLTFCAGLIAGWLLMLVSVFKNKLKVGQTKKQLAKVEREVENLRTMPIKDEI